MIDFIQGTLQPKFSNKDLENYVSERKFQYLLV